MFCVCRNGVVCLPCCGSFPFQIAVNIQVFTDFNIAAECVQRVWDASQHAGNVLHSHCLPVCGWLPFALLASLQMSDISPACSFHFFLYPFQGSSAHFPFPFWLSRRIAAAFILHANYIRGMCGTQCRIMSRLYNYYNYIIRGFFKSRCALNLLDTMAFLPTTLPRFFATLPRNFSTLPRKFTTLPRKMEQFQKSHLRCL